MGGGILLSIATYLVIVIPGLYNKSAFHGGYLNVGMWSISSTSNTIWISAVGIIGIILFALAFISTIGGIVLRKGGKVVSKKLTITSLVVLFVTTLIFILVIVSKPYWNYGSFRGSLIWGGTAGDGDWGCKCFFSIYGWVVLVIAILGGIGIVGSFVPLCFKKHNSLAK